ncbi:MAG: purine-cytosine permease family protein [Pseudonocardia sp.]
MISAASRPTAADRAGRVEHRGIDMVPPGQRQSSPQEFLWIWHSTQFSLGTVVLGALPIAFGLGWWATVSAVLFGLLLGTAVFAPLVRIGKRTGANDPISSGAHFGIRGRILANLITVLVALGFFAIAVWTGASAMLVAGQRLLGTPTDTAALAMAIPLVAGSVALVAGYGHRTLLAAYKLMTLAGGVVLLALVAVLTPRFDPGYIGGPYVLDGFWPTWLLAVSFAAALPISYSIFQGDYSRHLRPEVSDRSAMLWTGATMYTSNATALLVGAYVTTVLPDSDQPWVIGVTDVVPTWFAAVVVLFGLVGTVPQGGLCLYAAGLSANSVFWRASRVTTTLAVSVLGTAVLYLGAIVYDAIDSISTFVLVLLVLVSPWAAIMLVGFALHRGRYDPLDLHTFATPQHRGRYWYSHGFNPRAFSAFVPAVALGLLFVDNSLYTGPLAGLTGGIDLSWVVPFAVAALLYRLANWIAPDRTTLASAAGSGGGRR